MEYKNSLSIFINIVKAATQIPLRTSNIWKLIYYHLTIFLISILAPLLLSLFRININKNIVVDIRIVYNPEFIKLW